VAKSSIIFCPMRQGFDRVGITGLFAQGGDSGWLMFR
jgi:hypothetical protein